MKNIDIIFPGAILSDYESRIEAAPMPDSYTNFISNVDYGSIAFDIEDQFALYLHNRNLDNTYSLKCKRIRPNALNGHDTIRETIDDILANNDSKIVVLVETRGNSTDELVSKIRATRKDIFLVVVHNTNESTHQDQYIAGLNFLKANSVNLVVTRQVESSGNTHYMVVCPEEAHYYHSYKSSYVIRNLVDMIMKRSALTFTRSQVIKGDLIPWNDYLVPDTLRTVVNHCIDQGAYKTFRGVTAGHFAFKIDDTTFLTSKRKSNFNDLNNVGLVLVKAFDDHNVVAIGAKPSVGGQSQRIVFRDHPDLDCIVHFHCDTKRDNGYQFPWRSQRDFECGSHECGQNTSSGLVEVEPGIWAVMLLNHGPNIVFNQNIDPRRVIDFIDMYFDLSQKTSGTVSLAQ